MAEAITDLGEQTRNLVRVEVGAARRKMWGKAKESAPALCLARAALGLGTCAAASPTDTARATGAAATSTVGERLEE